MAVSAVDQLSDERGARCRGSSENAFVRLVTTFFRLAIFLRRLAIRFTARENRCVRDSRLLAMVFSVTSGGISIGKGSPSLNEV